jgi:small subunit ribosomal protein S16
VAVKIKLKRLGKIHRPQYRIVVADSRTKRDGRAIEEIGRYNPIPNPSLIEVDSARVQYWLGVGAKPTESVQKLLVLTGDWQKFTGEGDSAGSLEVAAPKASKEEAYTEAVAAAANVTEADTEAAAEAARRATSGEADEVATETEVDAVVAEAEEVAGEATEVADAAVAEEAAAVEVSADEKPAED